MSLKKIKSELNKLDKKKLVDLIAELYKKNKSVKEYFDFFVKPDEQTLFEKYRKKVSDSFYPTHNFHLASKLKEAKQTVSAFAKLETSPKYLADLKLFFVERGVEFINMYGDAGSSFESAIVRMYDEALELMWKEDLLEHFLERADKVVGEAYDGGSGFFDALNQTNLNYLADFHDDEEVKENSSSQAEAKIIPLSNRLGAEK